MINSLKKVLSKPVDWANAYSIWPAHLMTSCCGCEFGVVYSPKLDTERLGSLPFTHSRNTNAIVIEGTVTKKMAKVLKNTYDQMPGPKFVIAMGACAIDGGIFYNSYNIVKPWKIVPVESFIPGCPPRPEAVTHAIARLQKKIMKEGKASKEVFGEAGNGGGNGSKE